jgi:hypothetical protein
VINCPPICIAEWQETISKPPGIEQLPVRKDQSICPRGPTLEATRLEVGDSVKVAHFHPILEGQLQPELNQSAAWGRDE